MVSITMVGKWFVRRLNLAMAVYTVVLSVGFMMAFPLIGAMVIANGWRTTWWAIGLVLLFGLAPLSLLLVRRSPEACLSRTMVRLFRKTQRCGWFHSRASIGDAELLGVRSSECGLWPDCFGHRSIQ